MTATNASVSFEAAVDDPTPAAQPLTVAPPILPQGPAALLRGSAKGLEIVVDCRAPLAEIVAVLTARLGEAPGFFRGSDVRVRVDNGPLPPGALARLDEIATIFELRITEIGAHVAEPGPRTRRPAATDDAVPRPNLAHGSAPSSANDFIGEEDTLTRAPLGLPALDLVLDSARAPTVEVATAAAPAAAGEDFDDITVVPTGDPAIDNEASISRAITQEMTPLVVERVQERGARLGEATECELVAKAAAELRAALAIAEDEPALEPTTTRVVVGPVRSGVILDHPGHLIVFGDVNPGAEVRAEGNIVVLGRLRGTAHAGIGNDSGFILALRLEPQQLRICRQVARAGDSDAPGTEAEIAYVTDASIVVERYAGRLPKNLAASI